MLLVPSLNPEHVSWRGLLRVVEEGGPEPELGVPHRHRAEPTRARLRIAWTATWGSLAHACTTTSPPQRAGSRSRLGNFGQIGQWGRLWSAMPKRSLPSLDVKNPGPNPIVSVNWDAGRPRASPVSVGGAWGFKPTAPSRAASSPAVIRSAVGPLLEHGHHVGLGIGGDIEGAEVHPVLGRGDDPGLALAAEGHRLVQSRCAGR